VNLSLPRTLATTALALALAGSLPGVAAAASAPFGPNSMGISPPGAPSRYPSVSGVPQVGGVLTGDRGEWPDDPSPKSEWLRCSVAARTCETTGDTDLSYTATASDVGLVLKFRVTATRRTPLGTSLGTRAEDAQSAQIAGAPDPTAPPATPRNVIAPTILGTVQEGRVLTGSPGQWTGAAPIRFDYGWFACTPRDCKSVSTTRTYTPGKAEVGKKLILSVLGINAAGSSSRTVTTGALVKKRAALRQLSPFPRLVVGGRVAKAVTTVSSFRVTRVPRGSVVNLTCSGRGCPFRRQKVKTRRSTTVRVAKLERQLRSGMVIILTVRRGPTLGKYTRLRIRSGAAPARVDRCVRPGSSKPVGCS